jgi:hypothetical protein
MESPIEARKRWRAFGEQIEFTAEDWEVLDLTLSLVPDLRICAVALKYARAKKVRYPIESVGDLIKHLENGRFMAGRHLINAEEIKTYMQEGFFPIEHEGALLSRMYAALGRHRYEMAMLSASHPKTIARVVESQMSKGAK